MSTHPPDFDPDDTATPYAFELVPGLVVLDSISIMGMALDIPPIVLGVVDEETGRLRPVPQPGEDLDLPYAISVTFGDATKVFLMPEKVKRPEDPFDF